MIAGCGVRTRDLRWRDLVEKVATWTELQALQTEENIGEDLVFPMRAVNAWKRVKRAARPAGISEVPVSPHFRRYCHGTLPRAAAPTLDRPTGSNV